MELNSAQRTLKKIVFLKLISTGSISKVVSVYIMERAGLKHRPAAHSSAVIIPLPRRKIRQSFSVRVIQYSLAVFRCVQLYDKFLIVCYYCSYSGQSVQNGCNGSQPNALQRQIHLPGMSHIRREIRGEKKITFSE